MSVKLTLSLLLAALAVGQCANILDFFDWEDGKKLIDIPELRNDQSNSKCLCKGPACVCCVDFNITIIDLGGPGCVHMKYLSPEEGFSVKVSYGKSLIHTSKIQGSNPPPICLQVFGKFAQVCAKFNDLAPTADGLRGCLQLEPKLLGETQLEFPIGCFRSSAGGMEMEDPPATSTPTTETTTEEDSNEESSSGFDAEDFILGIYQTAEKGVAFINSLLDLPSKLNSTTTAPSTSTLKPEETTENQRRGPKNLKHPNQL